MKIRIEIEAAGHVKSCEWEVSDEEIKKRQSLLVAADVVHAHVSPGLHRLIAEGIGKVKST